MSLITKTKLVRDLSDEDLYKISELASQNLLLKEIALQLNINYSSLIRSWRDKESAVYQAHRKGIEEIELAKNQGLQAQVESGNMTAIQILEKQQYIRKFNDIKAEVFGI